MGTVASLNQPAKVHRLERTGEKYPGKGLNNASQSRRRKSAGTTGIASKSPMNPTRNLSQPESMDDTLSRTTESTKGSPEFGYPTDDFRTADRRRDGCCPLTSYECTPVFTKPRYLPHGERSEGHHLPYFNGGGLPTSALVAEASRMVGNDPFGPQDDQFVQRAQSQSIRVPKPPYSHQQSSCSTGTCDEGNGSGDAGDFEHWKKIYDLRTWNMFHRITEARKKMPPNFPSHCRLDATGGGFIDDEIDIAGSDDQLIDEPDSEDGYGQFDSLEDCRMGQGMGPAVSPFVMAPQMPSSDHEMVFGDLD